jgi:hypothetical protein
MIREVSRGHLRVMIDGKAVTVPGEMLFPPDGKLGFVVYVSGIKQWDAPDQGTEMTAEHVAAILTDIRAEFSKGGHLLEVEPEDASPSA